MKPRHAHWIGIGLAVAASAAVAQMPPPGWQGPPGPGYGYYQPPGVRDPREGKVEVQTFVAKSPRVAALGHGAIVIAAGPASFAGPGGPVAPGPVPGDGLFETALADQLTRAGYQAGGANPDQTVEFVVTRELIQPPEPPHSPVQGEVAAGAGSYGSGMGLGLSIDLSKPRGALIATRVEARISDTATHELLWQGRAEVLTREKDKRWQPDVIPGRLMTALFKGFPRPTSG